MATKLLLVDYYLSQSKSRMSLYLSVNGKLSVMTSFMKCPTELLISKPRQKLLLMACIGLENPHVWNTCTQTSLQARTGALYKQFQIKTEHPKILQEIADVPLNISYVRVIWHSNWRRKNVRGSKCKASFVRLYLISKTSVLKQLHWLPIVERIKFKILLLTYGKIFMVLLLIILMIWFRNMFPVEIWDPWGRGCWHLVESNYYYYFNIDFD